MLKDWRCKNPECAEIFEKPVSLDVTLEMCPICDGPAEVIFLSVPAGIIMRPEGWNLSPSDPKYSKLPKTDRSVSNWQLGSKRQRKPRLTERG